MWLKTSSSFPSLSFEIPHHNITFPTSAYQVLSKSNIVHNTKRKENKHDHQIHQKCQHPTNQQPNSHQTPQHNRSPPHHHHHHQQQQQTPLLQRANRMGATLRWGRRRRKRRLIDCMRRGSRRSMLRGREELELYWCRWKREGRGVVCLLDVRDYHCDMLGLSQSYDVLKSSVIESLLLCNIFWHDDCGIYFNIWFWQKLQLPSNMYVIYQSSKACVWKSLTSLPGREGLMDAVIGVSLVNAISILTRTPANSHSKSKFKSKPIPRNRKRQIQR